MSTTIVRTGLPMEARAFLTRLRRALWPLPEADRRETLDGVTAHIEDALGAGATPASVLVQLGTPESIADEAAEQFEARTGRTARPRLLNLARMLQFLAFAYTLVLALWALFGDVTIGMHVDQGGEVDPASIRAETMWDELADGTASPAWAILLTVALPTVITLVALLLTGRAWRIGMRLASYLLAAFILWTGIREGLPSLLAALWMTGPALVLEVAAALVPYRARVTAR